MKEKTIFFIEDKILSEVEELGDDQTLSFLLGHEVYQLNNEEKETDSYYSMGSFPQTSMLSEMLYQIKFSDASKVCVITTDQEKILEAKLLGISSCFYNTGYNDCCSLEATYEARNARQLLKVVR